jgi:peptidoglycan/LPS O-acetylase OafA/YrhL
MSAKPEVAGSSVRSSNAGQADDKRLKLGQAFDPRNNALNVWRLAMAMGVILWHSFPLTGRDIPFAPARQLLGEIWVDGFFAISGFLITSSWLGNPRLRDYFVARGLRILPGLWVCLVVTALVIAPIGVAIQGGSAAKLLLSRAPIEYILKNSAVWLLQLDIGGTPRGIRRPGEWNSSLWTLEWEVLCYIAVAGLGIVGLLSRRWLLPAALALALSWSALLPPWTWTVSEVPTLWQDGARFAVMFLAGALVHQFRNVTPARWSLVALSVVIVLAASLLPNYRLIAAVPLAYAITVSGALIHNKRFRLRTDLSYGVYVYAFPIQQLLVICGLGSMNPIAFCAIAAIAILPIAALSWILVEKPAMSLKSRLIRRRSGPTGGRQPGQTVSYAAEVSVFDAVTVTSEGDELGAERASPDRVPKTMASDLAEAIDGSEHTIRASQTTLPNKTKTACPD